MAKVVKMPVLGNSVEEVRIIQWFKEIGDTVAVGEKLAEVETDKTNIDFESPEAGVIRQILAPADTYIKVEAPVVVIGTADEPLDEGAPAPTTAVSAAAAPEATVAPVTPEPTAASIPVVTPPSPRPAGVGSVVLSPRARRAADQLGIDTNMLAGRGTGPQGRIQEKDVFALQAEQEAATVAAAGMGGGQSLGSGVRISPLARAVATDSGVDLTGVSGSGAGGRIVADDVRSVTPAPTGVPTPVAAPAPTSPASTASTPAATTGPRTVQLTGLRKRVADNLLKSVRNAPHVTLNLSAEMTEAMRLRSELLPRIEKATGIRVSPTDIVVKACAVALRELPYMNAHIQEDTITLFDAVHIGLAVSLGEDGLIVPIIKDVHRKGLADLAKDRNDLANRARAGQLKSEDITGGTFTVTNLGNYGIESFNPIIPPPQVAILGVGAITDTVVARNGQPAVRPMMGLSLSFDHRAIDGAPAAAFLARIKEILETPYLMLV